MKIVNKDKVKNYVLRLIGNQRKDFVAKTAEAFDISRASVYNYIKQMSADGTIEKQGNNYVLKTKEWHYAFQNNGKLNEDRICADIMSEHIDFDKNVLSMWTYAFSEMMNNAIEHSEAENIYVDVFKNCFETRMRITDDGIGIFKNIRRFMMEVHGEDIPIKECVSLLFAGKFTTAEKYHSGEGIFFTSQIMDEFAIYSDGNVFTRNNFKSKQELSDMNFEHGTVVNMSLNNKSKKSLKALFDTFAPTDEGFIKTAVPVSHMFPGGFPVSRSEARRLLKSVSSFSDVVLDFKDVDDIGQGFTHELFVVGKAQYPNVNIKVVNANESVTGMIKRVLNTQALKNQ